MENSNGSSCFSVAASNLVIFLIIGIITFIVIRVFYVIYWSSQPRHATPPQQSLSTLIVMGSGGHTAEMLNLLSVLQKNRFKPRYYVVAATDNMSLQKEQVFENSLLNEVPYLSSDSSKYNCGELRNRLIAESSSGDYRKLTW